MEEINLRDLWAYFKKHLILFVTFVVLVIMGGTFYTIFIQKPEYKAQATVILSSDKSKNTVQNEINANKNLIDTYTEVAKSHRVLDRVKREMQIDDSYERLVKKITVSSLKNTEIISEDAFNASQLKKVTFNPTLKSIKNRDIETIALAIVDKLIGIKGDGMIPKESQEINENVYIEGSHANGFQKIMKDLEKKGHI